MDVVGAPVLARLEEQEIELPSWAFGNSGTRFKVFGQPGVPRDPFEKVADAAKVHELTGLAPRVALHIPWDKVDDYGALAAHAESLGVRLGTVNSNTFQDDEYKLGSLTHAEKAVRRRAIDHHVECIDVMDRTGSRDLKIWLADGTNYPGQGDIRARQEWLLESLARDLRPPRRRPAAGARVQVLRAGVLPHRRPGLGYRVRARQRARTQGVRLPRHRPPRAGTNIEFIVAQLLRLGKLGSFDFNSRFYADDDLIVGAADPFQLFRILFEVVRGGGFGRESAVAFMLDQCHNIEKKIPGQIRSVLNVQEMTARALLVDREALASAQAEGDVLGANEVVMDAFYTDVRPALAAWRESRGLPGNPMRAYAESGYQEHIEASRVGGTQAGWGA